MDELVLWTPLTFSPRPLIRLWSVLHAVTQSAIHRLYPLSHHARNGNADHGREMVSGSPRGLAGSQGVYRADGTVYLSLFSRAVPLTGPFLAWPRTPGPSRRTLFFGFPQPTVRRAVTSTGFFFAGLSLEAGCSGGDPATWAAVGSKGEFSTFSHRVSGRSGVECSSADCGRDRFFTRRLP